MKSSFDNEYSHTLPFSINSRDLLRIEYNPVTNPFGIKEKNPIIKKLMLKQMENPEERL
jgi:hypothetical protein